MWRFNVFLLVFSVSFAGSLSAQTLNDSLRFVDRMWAMKKKAIVLDYMNLTEAEKSAFWPVYESYATATQLVEMESVYLLACYTQNSGNLSDRELENLSRRILRNDLALAKIRKQYYKRFKQALSTDKATAFMQLDNTFRSMIRMDIQKDSPPMELLEGALLTKASIH